MTPRPGADPHLDVGAYVLHALPPDEEAAFENHLAGCAECRTEVDGLAATANLLGEAVEERTPSPEVRRRVLQQISSIRVPTARGDGLTPVVTRSHRRRVRALAVSLAASVAAAAGLGGVAWWQTSAANTARQEAAQVHDGAQVLAGVLSAPDAAITAERLPQGATASVITSRSQNRAAFVATGLRPLTDDRVYELWYAEGKSFRPAGLLSGAGGWQAYVLDGPLEGATAVGITVEPAGGSRQPTTPPLGLVAVPG
ncbi:anti-sigma factor [Streptomyces sp. NPDC002690]